MPLVAQLQQYGAGDTPASANIQEFMAAPVLVCAGRECPNSTGLMKCKACLKIQYCSRECQRADWSLHQASCRAMKRLNPRTPYYNTAFCRHMRHFVARFELSLVTATIAALGLRTTPTNIDNRALWLTLTPRAHREAGARFVLVSAEVLSMTELRERFAAQAELAGDAARGAAVLEEHRRHREEERRRTHGEEDCATMVICAMNVGPHRDPDAGAGETKFKPIAVSRRLMRQADPTVQWEISLRMQIEMDLPNRPR